MCPVQCVTYVSGRSISSYQIVADEAFVCFELVPSSSDDLAPILARVPTGLLAFESKPFPVVQGVDEELPIVSAIAKAKI